jgi:hypothetical protein
MKHKACYGTMFQELLGLNPQSKAHEAAVTDNIKPHGLAPPDSEYSSLGRLRGVR